MRTTIILKPTHRCNFNCKYCYDAEARNRLKITMPKEDLLLFLTNAAKEFGALELIWHGGEPTILGIDYLDYVMDGLKDYDICYYIQTNGSLLNEEWIKLFKKYNVSLGVSYDGLTQNDNRNFVNIIELKDLCLKYDIRINTLSTVTPYNCDSLLESLIWTIQNGMEPSFNLLFGSVVNEEEYNKILESYKDVFNYICQQPHFPLVRPFKDMISHYCGLEPSICELQYCGCNWYSILPDGIVLPCGKNWDYSYSYGNLYKNTWNEIKQKNNKIRFQTILDGLYEKCHRCKYFRICRNGCPFRASLTPNLFDEGYCKFQYKLLENVYNIIEMNLKNNTLVNYEILDLLYKGPIKRGELI